MSFFRPLKCGTHILIEVGSLSITEVVKKIPSASKTPSSYQKHSRSRSPRKRELCYGTGLTCDASQWLEGSSSLVGLELKIHGNKEASVPGQVL